MLGRTCSVLAIVVFLTACATSGFDTAKSAYSALQAQRWQEAVTLYQKAIDERRSRGRYDGTAAGWYNNLGVALSRLDRLNESYAAYDNAVRLSPTKELYRKNLLSLSRRLGRTSVAASQEAALQALAEVNKATSSLYEWAEKRFPIDVSPNAPYDPVNTEGWFRAQAKILDMEAKMFADRGVRDLADYCSYQATAYEHDADKIGGRGFGAALNELSMQMSQASAQHITTLQQRASQGSRTMPPPDSGRTSAQECTPIPPACSNANTKAEQLIQEFPRTSGISDSASRAYCTLLVGIEVNSFCASEYRKQGRQRCAQIVDQQVAEYQRNLPATERTISAASVSRARQACSWER